MPPLGPVTTPGPAPAVDEQRARELLAFEAAHGRARDRDDRIRRDLGLTPARYRQLLLRVIDTELALRVDPILTHRLIRQRDQARARRAGFLTAPTL